MTDGETRWTQKKAPLQKAEPMTTNAQGVALLTEALDAFPPYLSARDRRIRSVVLAARDALRKGRPLSEVAEYAAQEVYGFCLLPGKGPGS
jgi:hypothetical protein